MKQNNQLKVATRFFFFTCPVRVYPCSSVAEKRLSDARESCLRRQGAGGRGACRAARRCRSASAARVAAGCRRRLRAVQRRWARLRRARGRGGHAWRVAQSAVLGKRRSVGGES